jgi:mRNA interferase MazF
VVEVMRRGEVWVARLNPNQGGEVGKVRPVVIAQADVVTEAGLSTVLVIPLTTQHRPATAPLRVAVAARERLLKDSYAMTDQVRPLDRSRFGDGPLTTLTAEELAAVERSLKAVLGMW